MKTRRSVSGLRTRRRAPRWRLCIGTPGREAGAVYLWLSEWMGALVGEWLDKQGNGCVSRAECRTLTLNSVGWRREGNVGYVDHCSDHGLCGALRQTFSLSTVSVCLSVCRSKTQPNTCLTPNHCSNIYFFTCSQ